MEPIRGVEINGVHDRCMREPINVADDEHTHDTLDSVIKPAMDSLPPTIIRQEIFEQLVAVLIMGLGIGARVIEERALRHVKAAVEELEAGFKEAWPLDQVANIEDPGWMNFSKALDHLRDIEREAGK